MFDMVLGMAADPGREMVGDTGPVSECVSAAGRAADERVGVLSAQIHALTAQLVDELAVLDENSGWGGPGFRSFPHYLSVRAGFVPREAERLTRLAKHVSR